MSRYRDDICSVYFARRVTGEGSIKIGSSYNPSNRVQVISKSLPVRCEVLASGRGSYAIEFDLHGYFRRHCVEGEWFEPVNELLELIERVKAGEALPVIMETMEGTQSHYETLSPFHPDFARHRLPTPIQSETA